MERSDLAGLTTTPEPLYVLAMENLPADNGSAEPFRLSRDSWLFLSYWAIIGLVVFGAESVVRNLYLDRLGLEADRIGFLEGVAALTAAILALPAGLWGRYANNRTLAITGALFWTAGLVTLPAVELIPVDQQYAWLVAVYLLRGIGPALFVSNFTAFLSSGARTETNRRFVFSRVDAAFPAGKFIGALLGGAVPGLLVAGAREGLSGTAPFRNTLWIFSIVGFLGLILLFSTEKNPKTGSVAMKSLITGTHSSIRPLLPFLFVLVLFAILHVAAISPLTVFFSLYMNSVLGVQPAGIGFALGAGQLLGVGAALLVPAMTRKSGALRAAVVALLAIGAGVMLVALVPAAPAASAGVIVTMAMNAIVLPVSTTLHQSRVPEQWRSTASSVWFASSSAARMIVATGSGALIVSKGFTAVYLVSGVCAVLAAGAFAVLYRIRTHRT